MEWRVVIAAVFGGLVTALVMWAIARRSSGREHDGESLKVLARRYRFWEALGVGLMLLSVLGCWLVLLQIAQRIPPPDPIWAFRLTPSWLYWAAAAFFLGNLVATGPTHVLYWWLLGERFTEFRSYQARKFGFDSGRWLLPFYLTFGSLTLWAIALLLDWYVLIGPEGIVVDDFATWSSETYSYETLIEIRAAESHEKPDGTTEPGWSFVLHFDDGSRWSSLSNPAGSDSQLAHAIADYISAHSDLPIVEVQLLYQSEL